MSQKSVIPVTLALMLSVFFILLSTDSGAEKNRDGGDDIRLARSFTTVANTQSRDIDKQFARMRADMQKLTSAYRQIITRIKENEKTLSSLEKRMDRLQSRVARLGDGKDSEEVRNIRRNLQKLESELETERRQRRQTEEKLVNTVSSEIAAALSEFEDSSGGQSRQQPESRGTYTVKKGDTLSAIAQAFEVSIDDLRDINNLKSDLIREGQKILIPE